MRYASLDSDTFINGQDPSLLQPNIDFQAKIQNLPVLSKENKTDVYIKKCNPLIKDNLRYLADMYNTKHVKIARILLKVGSRLL